MVFLVPGCEAVEAWIGERALQILGQGPRRGRRGCGAARPCGTSPKTSARGSTAARIILKYREMLRYDRYLALGFPIATGVIEGACRHLVKDRIDITGARWGLRSAEAVLKLRSLHSSGDTEAYWTFHKAREQERNHRSRMTSHFFERRRDAPSVVLKEPHPSEMATLKT